MERKKNRRRPLKFLSLALAILMSALCLAACSGNNDDTPDETTVRTTEETTTAIQTIELSPDDDSVLRLISEGNANVRIIYQLDGGAIFAMEVIRNSLKEMSGVKVSAIPDLANDLNEEALEIVIGNTRYAASEEALREMEPNSYSIGVSGNKIVVVSDNTYLYQTAGEALIEALLMSSDGEVVLRKEFSEKSESYPVLTLATNLKSAYTIVYPNGDEAAQTQATVLKNGFQSVGITVPVTSDTAAASGKEILIGKTNRPLSADDPSYYLNAYSGCDADGNLAILGNLSAGVDTLINYLENITMISRDVEIPQFLFGFSTPKGYGNPPEYKGGGTVKLIENFEEFGSYYIQAWGATVKDYKNYAETLTGAGFVRYDHNQTRENLFSTYTDGYSIINLSYLEYRTPVNVNGAKAGETVSYINIAVESTESSALPPIEAEGPAVTTPQLTMLNSACAFLIRMKDGRFIFIDGNVDAASGRVHADLFYEQLVSQNVLEGKPVVAAWIITHPHGDHIAGVLRTLQKYHDFFTIERLLCNFQSEETLTVGTGPTMVEEGPYNYRWQRTVFNEVLRPYPDIKLYTVHIGQRFVFTGLEIEILWTPENLCQPFAVGNEASVLFKFSFDEGSFLVTGDAQPINCKLTNAIWEDGASADLLQFAHHGMRGGDVEFYATVNAQYAIWTNCWETVKDSPGMHNNPSYNGVDPYARTKIFIPTNTEPVFIFYPGMPESALEPYIHNRDLMK